MDLTTGLPIARNLHGVIGFGNSRFYHHPLPILGVLWMVNEHVRIEAIYPEPAVVFTLSATRSLRLGGELTYGGFSLDGPTRRAVVEYESYRVGAVWSAEWRPGLKLEIGAGVETERSFDFFREPRRVHRGGVGYLKLGASFSR